MAKKKKRNIRASFSPNDKYAVRNILQNYIRDTETRIGMPGFWKSRLHFDAKEFIEKEEKNFNLRERNAFHLLFMYNSFDLDSSKILKLRHLHTNHLDEWYEYGTRKLLAESFIRSVTTIADAQDIAAMTGTVSDVKKEASRLSSIFTESMLRHEGEERSKEDNKIIRVVSSCNVLSALAAQLINWDKVFESKQRGMWYSNMYTLLRNAAEANGSLEHYEKQSCQVMKSTIDVMAEEIRSAMATFVKMANEDYVAHNEDNSHTIEDLMRLMNTPIGSIDNSVKFAHLILTAQSACEAELRGCERISSIRNVYTSTEIFYACCKYLQDFSNQRNTPSIFLVLESLALLTNPLAPYHIIHSYIDDNKIINVPTNKGVQLSSDVLQSGVQYTHAFPTSIDEDTNGDDLIIPVRDNYYLLQDLIGSKCGRIVPDYLKFDETCSDMLKDMGYTPKERHLIIGYIAGSRAATLTSFLQDTGSVGSAWGGVQLNFERAGSITEEDLDNVKGEYENKLEAVSNTADAKLATVEKKLRIAEHRCTELEKEKEYLLSRLKNNEEEMNLLMASLPTDEEGNITVKDDENEQEEQEITFDGNSVGVDYKCVVYGGHSNLVHQLEPRFSHIRFVPGGVMPNEELVRNADLLILNICHTKHKHSYRIKRCRSTEKKPYVYIAHSGANTVATQIYNLCREYEQSVKET